MSIFEYKSLKIDFRDPELRFSVGTPFTKILVWSFFITISLTISLFAAGYSKEYILPAALALVVTVVAHLSTDCAHIIDTRRRTVDYYQHILGSVERTTLCEFDEIHCVSVTGWQGRARKHRGKVEFFIFYKPVIVTKEGDILPISNLVFRELSKCHELVELLAEKFGVSFIAGEEKSSISVRLNPRTNAVKVSHKSMEF